MSRYLEERIAELSEEIRSYPTPIARCDEQLTALIEQRKEIFRDMEKECCSAEALWTNDGGFNAA
jgi:chorismate mutase